MDEQPPVLELFDQLKGGSKQAFDILYARYLGRFYWLACKRGLGHEDAEEAVDDTFLRILATIHVYDPSISSPQTWMTLLCNHAITNKYRKTKKYRCHETELVDGEESGQGYEDKGFDDVEDDINDCEAETFRQLSPEDQAEIKKERGRGRYPRPEYQAATDRWKAAAQICRETRRGTRA